MVRDDNGTTRPIFTVLFLIQIKQRPRTIVLKHRLWWTSLLQSATSLWPIGYQKPVMAVAIFQRLLVEHFSDERIGRSYFHNPHVISIFIALTLGHPLQRCMLAGLHWLAFARCSVSSCESPVLVNVTSKPWPKLGSRRLQRALECMLECDNKMLKDCRSTRHQNNPSAPLPG